MRSLPITTATHFVYSAFAEPLVPQQNGRDERVCRRTSSQRLAWSIRGRRFWQGLMLSSNLFLTTFISAAQLFHAQGEMAGEPGADSVLLQSRLTAAESLNKERGITGAPGVARFIVDRGSDGTTAVVTPWLKAE